LGWVDVFFRGMRVKSTITTEEREAIKYSINEHFSEGKIGGGRVNIKFEIMIGMKYKNTSQTLLKW